MAHVCVIVFPALLLSTLRVKSQRAFGWWSAAIAAVAAALVLSRSRAAWLALMACVVVMLAFAYFAARRARGMVRWRRLPLLAVIAAAGGGISLVMPNTLNWKSDSPYLETAKSVVNYREGSGRGRLVQYKNSARMSLHHPVLGVGPGNWAVVYPKFASPGDPSLASDGMTANPWPSSDWMTFLSERALLGTVAVLLVVSTFDAVLLLPAPALVAWGLLGALSPPSRARTIIELPTSRRIAAMLLVTIFGGLAIARSTTQLAAMDVFESSTRASRVERAAEL